MITENQTQSASEASIAVMGSWHLAYVTAASLLRLGHKVLLVDPQLNDPQRIPSCPVIEPGVDEILKSAYEEQRFSWVVEEDVSWKAKYAWLAIDTPVDEQDRVDVTPLLDTINDIKINRNVHSNLIILNSQVPLGFCTEVEARFGFELAYVPENLRLGYGLETFLNADRTIIGAQSPKTVDVVKKLLTGIESEFLCGNLVSAEMSKHATNAFLATSISFANELARLGQLYGVDSRFIEKALRTDSRIGPKARVSPGLGFSGGTLPRDLRVLQSLGQAKGIETPLVNAVLEVNQSVLPEIVDRLESQFEALNGKCVLVLGYSYKAETNTVRRSATLELLEILEERGCVTWGLDPNWDQHPCPERLKFKHHSCVSDLSAIPDAVIVMVQRKEFDEIDWESILAKFNYSKSLFILDTSGNSYQTYLKPDSIHYRWLWDPRVVASPFRSENALN